jgi:hypothetical protein
VCSPQQWDPTCSCSRTATEQVHNASPRCYHAAVVWQQSQCQQDAAVHNLPGHLASHCHSLHQAALLLSQRLLSRHSINNLHLPYLLCHRFIKRINEGRGAQGLVETKLAYEFSLDTVGQDLGAGGLWQVGVA